LRNEQIIFELETKVACKGLKYLPYIEPVSEKNQYITGILRGTVYPTPSF